MTCQKVHASGPATLYLKKSSNNQSLKDDQNVPNIKQNIMAL